MKPALFNLLAPRIWRLLGSYARLYTIKILMYICEPTYATWNKLCGTKINIVFEELWYYSWWKENLRIMSIFLILLWWDRRILYVDKRWRCDLPQQYFKSVENSGRRSFINLCVCTYIATRLVTMSLHVRHACRRDWRQNEQCKKRNNLYSVRAR